jgi:hypothetical protein
MRRSFKIIVAVLLVIVFLIAIVMVVMPRGSKSTGTAVTPNQPSTPATPTPNSKTTVLINEVEANPAGKDAGAEKVELYNPSDSSVSLSGWSVSALHGTGHKFTIASGVSIAAHGYYVITFTAQFLDNSGEVVVLYNAGHSEVDRTPAHDDSGDNSNTWQRVPNGTDTGSAADWKSKAGTMGAKN